MNGKKITSKQLRATIRDSLAAQKDKPKKPTGACTIKVYGLDDTCTEGLTQQGCLDVASKVGGVATWVENGKCPKK